MNGVIIAYDPREGIATVDAMDGVTECALQVPIKLSRHNVPMIGRVIRCNICSSNTGVFLGFQETDRTHSSPVVFTGVVTRITARYAQLFVHNLGNPVCLPLCLLAGEQSPSVGLTDIVDVFLRRGTLIVDRVIAVRASTDGPGPLLPLTDVVRQVLSEKSDSLVVPVRGAAQKLTSSIVEAVDPAVHTGISKVHATNELSSVVVKLEPEDIEYCSDQVTRQFGGRSGSHLGTWSITGFDPSFFFPPELSIRFICDGTELINATPPLMCQGTTTQIQIWCLWVTEGSVVDLRIVDEDGVDVTTDVAKVSILVPDETTVTMDGVVHQLVCSFEVELLPFHMDETCELLFEIRAFKRGLLLPQITSAADSGCTMRAEHLHHDSGSEDADCVSTAILSRPIFVRSAAVAVGERVLDENSLSHRYWVRNVLTPDEKIVSGFTDPGRSNTLLQDSSSYVTLDVVNSEREVIVVDRDDTRLKGILDAARLVIDRLPDTWTKATSLLWFVDTLYNNNHHFNKAVDELIELQQKAPLSKKGRGRQSVASRKRQRGHDEGQPKVIRLGDVDHGVCRHRSLLFKYLSDHLKIPCYLVRGEHQGPTDAQAERHTWNVVALKTNKTCLLLADATLSPQQLLEWPHSSYHCSLLELPAEGVSCVALTDCHKPVIFEECARGACASVRRCTIGGLTCVVKLPRQSADLKTIEEEYRVLQHFSQTPHVVQTLGWYRGILLQHYPLSLLAFMNMLLLRRSRLGTGQMKQVLVGVLTALTHVHTAKYVHRDVKAENVLINYERCKGCLQFGTVCKDCSLTQVALADFADSYHLGQHGSDPTTSCPCPLRVGTAPYAAPEIEYGIEFSYASDLWSVGILVSEMLLMQLPNRASCPHGRVDSFVVQPEAASTLSSTAAPSSQSIFVPGVGLNDPDWAAAVMKGTLQVNWRDRITATAALSMVSPKPASEGREEVPKGPKPKSSKKSSVRRR